MLRLVSFSAYSSALNMNVIWSSETSGSPRTTGCYNPSLIVQIYRDEVLVAVNIKTMGFWYVTSCNMGDRYQNFASIFSVNPKDWGRTFLRNAGSYLPPHILYGATSKYIKILTESVQLHLDQWLHLKKHVSCVGGSLGHHTVTNTCTPVYFQQTAVTHIQRHIPVFTSSIPIWLEVLRGGVWIGEWIYWPFIHRSTCNYNATDNLHNLQITSKR
jgi:hypothetical protein